MTGDTRKKIFKGIGFTFVILSIVFGPIFLGIGGVFLASGGYFDAGRNSVQQYRPGDTKRALLRLLVQGFFYLIGTGSILLGLLVEGAGPGWLLIGLALMYLGVFLGKKFEK